MNANDELKKYLDKYKPQLEHLHEEGNDNKFEKCFINLRKKLDTTGGDEIKREIYLNEFRREFSRLNGPYKQLKECTEEYNVRECIRNVKDQHGRPILDYCCSNGPDDVCGQTWDDLPELAWKKSLIDLYDKFSK